MPNYPVSKAGLLAELVTLAEARKIANPVTQGRAGVFASGVTVTQEASVHAGHTYQINPLNSTANSPISLGNQTLINGGGSTIRAADLLNGATVSRYETLIDGDSFVWNVPAGSASTFRIEIDGLYTQADAYDTTAGAFVYVTMPLGVHRVAIERFQSSGVADLWLKPTATAVKPNSRVISFGAVGDSYTQGTGSLFTPDLWANAMCRILGWAYSGNGEGGTGYVNPGPSTIFGSATRLAYLTGKALDVIGIAGGINDAGAPYLTNITAAALTYYRAVRTLQPRALIIVFGAFAGSTGPSANVLAAEAEVKAAFDAWADPFSIYVPISDTTNGRAWIRGTGRVGATNASGNSDIYIGGTDGNDNTHPYQRAGHWYLGARAAEGVLGKMQRLLVGAAA